MTSVLLEHWAWWRVMGDGVESRSGLQPPPEGVEEAHSGAVSVECQAEACIKCPRDTEES